MHRRTIRGLALVILIFAAVLCLMSAFAQTSKAPKVGSRPSGPITPKGLDRLQTCRNGQGTKLWAGDCEALELRRSVPAAETNEPSPAQTTGTVPTVRSKRNRESHRFPINNRYKVVVHHFPDHFLSAVDGHLHANPIFFRTPSNPVSWNVASWPRPCLSNTLIFSRAPSGSDRRSPTASSL
jgi:hypothetical protein